MAEGAYDIVFIADARFPGGTSTALISEIEAARISGFSMGLLHVEGPVLRRPRPFHSGIRAAINKGHVQLLDFRETVCCRLAIVHHPMLFSVPLARELDIHAEQSVLVAHHPAYDNAGVEQYDICCQLNVLAQSTGLRPKVAPVGPNVRKSLLRSAALLTDKDWHNLINVARWKRPFRPFGDPIVIGRHARPDPQKWPNSLTDLFAAYPRNDARFLVEILGAAPFLTESICPTPTNWRLHEFGALDVREFLHRLDAYVYFHSREWIEAFGYGVLEALASGLPAILPRTFEGLFGEGAIYAEPAEVTPLLIELASHPSLQREQHRRALATVKNRYSLNQFPGRLREMFNLKRPGRIHAFRSKVRSEPKRDLALFISSNGVGLGHLTRQMAIARKLPESIMPVFLTLSRAARLAREAGYLVEHLPFHRYLKTTPDRWNEMIERELDAVLRFYGPAVLIFDGNVPYSGLIGALRKHRHVRCIWVRRGFWRADEGSILRRSRYFDAVIEPGDLAGIEDDGPTRTSRDRVISVDPVLMLAPGERLTRRDARRELGLSARSLVVGLQLGSGANFDFSAARERIISRVLERKDTAIVELLSPVTDEASEVERADPRHHPMRLYPAFRYSTGFDAFVCAAGYNSFHESLYGCMPTLFVANRAEEMDRQDLRADFATAKGMALSWSGLNLTSLDRQLDKLMEKRRRTLMRKRMSALTAPSGAEQAATLILEMLRGARTMGEH